MLLVTGCNQPRDVHEIEGVSDKFCVPERHKVGHIPWIPSDVPKGSGFAFSGCWRGDLEEIPGCLLPKMVVGGVAESSGDFRTQRWKDFGDKSLLKRTINGQDAQLDATDSGRIIVASNSHTYWGWFVWRKATPLSDDSRVAIDGADELLATCRRRDVALHGTSKTRSAIMCERKVLGKEYALNYSFESEAPVPKDIAKLDAEVFAGIDRWRCKR